MTLFAVLCMASCNGSYVHSKEELQAYVLNPDNRLVHEYTQGDLTVKIMYRPKDLVVQQQVTTGSLSEIDSLRELLKDYEYFVVSISGSGKEVESYYMERNASRYGALTQYLSTGLADDISANVCGESIQVHEAHYVPHFGSSKSTSVLLVFKELYKGDRDDTAIVFSDSFFGLGTHEFSFDIDKIQKIPQLHTESFTL